MPNQYVNKVIYDGNTLIDLTQDTVTQSDVLSGVYVHLPDGSRVQGSCTYNADTSDATATSGAILYGETAYVNGNKITGSMTNVGQQTSVITTKAQSVSISQGYHDGSGSVSIDSTEQGKIISSNILQGVTILGVTGNVVPGSSIQIESSKTATPTSSQQTILPSSGYDALAQVVVNAVPYVETDNLQGGKTVTIL